MLGSDPSDVESLQQVVADILEKHPADKILILMDENLDFRVDGKKKT